MNPAPESVTELPTDGAALVHYATYKKAHPTPPSDRDLAAQKPDAKILILQPGEAVIIDYSNYDAVRLAPQPQDE